MQLVVSQSSDLCIPARPLQLLSMSKNQPPSHLTPEEQDIWTEMMVKSAKVHEHNQRMMEEAGVPHGGHSPRRGFARATQGDYIIKIERRDHTKANGKIISFWLVDTSPWPPDDQPPFRTSLNHGWIIGPRGKCRKTW